MADEPTSPGAYPYGPPPPATQVPVVQPQPTAPRRRRPSVAWKVIKIAFVIVVVLGLMFSVLLNVVLVAALAAGGMGGDRVMEETVPDLGTPGAEEKIAVIEMDGIIEPTNADRWAQMVDKARRDDDVKAVVLQINSPGGGMTSSDELHARLLKLKDTNKPIVVSMGGVAASGGYYIAMPADEIVAQPTTITGSVGVMMPHFNIAELMKRYGIKDETFVAKGSDKKYSVSWTRETTPEGRKMVQDILDDAYERFISIVVAGRPDLTEERIRELADGSVYTANRAKNEGLVDLIGYLDDAVDRAKTLAKLTDFRVVRYVRPFSLRALLQMKAQPTEVKIDPSRLLAPEGPQVLYLWPGWSDALLTDLPAPE